jgi:hypothetical protein
MVDASDVENIIDDLCTTPSSSTPPCPDINNHNAASGLTNRYQRTQSQEKTGRVVSAAELGLHFRRATTVPYNSFLWKMLRHLVDVISPNSHISYPTSFIGFTKAVWADLLVQFDGYWERKEMIPLIDIFGEGLDESMYYEDDRSGSLTKPAFIDFRFNLLHQKLSMVNCCISRELARRQDEQVPSPSSTPATPRGDSSSEEPDLVLPKGQSNSRPVSMSGSTELEDDASKDATEDATTPSNIISISNVDETQEALAKSLDKMDVNASSTSPNTTVAIPSPKDDCDAITLPQGEGGLKPFRDLKLLATGAPLMIPKLQVSSLGHP